ncbi:MAG: SIS domain-containing protein [Candidatus Aminicenantes bacterium]|nr:SIS domain-containing protein [Candidatus Aminicenantes bacterium]
MSARKLRELPALVKKTIDLASTGLADLAKILKNKNYLHFLGHGISYGACLEAALKFKEITYIPCEAMYSSEFKHGPLAVISPEDWVVFISSAQDSRMTISHLNEIACRQGKVALIGPADEAFRLNADYLFEIPSDEYYFCPILSAVASQVLAYLVSQELGLDPDQPRNISKTLTVD